jgi:hypothetical protein
MYWDVFWHLMVGVEVPVVYLLRDLFMLHCSCQGGHAFLVTLMLCKRRTQSTGKSNIR